MENGEWRVEIERIMWRKMMRNRKALRFGQVGVIATLVLTVLVGCGGGQGTSSAVDTGGSETYVSKVLDTSYPDALNASSQLALGTLQLEGTENAVRPEQAAALLPLWQALRGGVTVQAEMNAVLKQIEGTMSQEQLAAIAAMRLTRERLRTWMEEQGLGGPGGFPSPGSGQAPSAPGGTPGSGQAPGAGGGQDVSPEVRATREAEFGGGEVPPEMATRRAGFENMSEEERQALRATMQAGGGMPGGPGGRGAAGGTGGRGGAGGGQFMILLDPLIELLTQRATPGTTNQSSP